MEFGFAQHLDDVAAGLRGERKGTRTRARLKAAAARVLDVKGYHDMQIGEVSDEAGVSVGAIYKHFPNKRALVLEVLSNFIAYNGELMLAVPRLGGRHAQLLATNLCHVRLYAANVGLMRCVRQLSDELPEFNKLWLDTNARWYAMVAKSIQRHGKAEDMTALAAMATAHALGGMVDEFLHDLYIRRNEALKSLRKSPRKTAEILSTTWYRAVYLSDPGEENSSTLSIEKTLEQAFHERESGN